jgi:tRNA nucleotidyltransferase (CCA-adding enzyme)
MAVAGLRLLTHLHQLVPTPNSPPSVDLVTCLVSFTRLQDPWNSPAAHESATQLLASLLPPSETALSKETLNLLTEILQTRVKPLFAKDPNSTLTEQARKAAYPLPGKLLSSEAETVAKPWKFQDVWVVTVYQWVLSRLEESLIESQWPLLIPPLLTILDDELTANKIRGCELLRTFLSLTPSALLQRTGLGEVFQDTLMPCLSYLPSLTPETESLELLRAVYPTLLALLRARFPDAKDKAQKEKVLDKIMRQGVLGGYTHAGEYVEIATLLVTKMGDLVDEMGIDSVKHLKVCVYPFLVIYGSH